jgi:energy-coupling factor transporter ATP-binding protein EcfA2
MDSGWIDCDDVTTLIGVNEAGKSNLLLALWKLNPAKGGEINFADDMPVTLFSELREADIKPKFIQAVFKITSDRVLTSIATKAGFDKNAVKTVQISRDYDGTRFIHFPDALAYTSLPQADILNVLQDCISQISSLDEAGKTESGIKAEAEQKITKALSIVADKTALSKTDLIDLSNCFKTISAKQMQTSKIRPIIDDLSKYFSTLSKGFDKPSPSANEEIRKTVVANMPKFVYYSNYGNLDSEIYLPHAIDNMRRDDLSGIAEAKARTLKVLFEYVKLDPQEILNMGEDAKGQTDSYGREVAPPTDAEIQEKAEKKKERDILLQSASTKLTRDFRTWWNQGNYTFDFSADGKHFRIWVADEVRPERIVLENRSTGLQWFLSFYLVFLVESQDAHAGAILLLDEAGLSLHPLAQRDLSAFFNSLSDTNQIINTTHSPFVINTNHIDRAMVVYIDKDGYSIVSNDLRAAEGRLQTGAVYAVHAALGLSVSDVILQGCMPIIVEGTSDQFYFNAIKLFLISQKLIAPIEEIVFVPSGGVKAVGSLASLLSAKSELPYIILDSDKSGQDFKDKLEKNLYSGEKGKILSILDFTSLSDSEVEDIIPFELLQRPIDRLFSVDMDFSTVFDNKRPLIPQIEKFALDNALDLPVGYKVELARQFKQALITRSSTFDNKDCISIWQSIFDKFLNKK